MDDFPKLTEPRVFLASPGDVAYVRAAVISEMEQLRQQVADDQIIRLYAWEIDKAKDGFDDHQPAQQQIPLPDDPYCMAVVCLLGEKIGTPLADNFPLYPLDGLNLCDDSLDYRLVHPWKPSAAEHGGFALTGTTFEFLAALAANQRRQPRPEQGLPPILLCIVGDDTIYDQKQSPGEANWGLGVYNEAIRRDEKNLDKLRQRIDDACDQRWQLNNFVRYLQKYKNIYGKTVSGADELLPILRTFLVDKLHLSVEPGDHDPFKGLDVYDVKDKDVFFGRTRERDEAVINFYSYWVDHDKPNAFAIIGGSGVGKSSFLRAGVMARLREERVRGRFLDCMLSPGDLLPGEASAQIPASSVDPAAALQHLFMKGLERITRESKNDSELSSRLLELGAHYDAIASERRPSFAVGQLSKALDLVGNDVSLLYGFDQFEELVDQRGDAKTGPLWRPVAEFFALAVQCGRIGLLYTLQANRVELIAKDPLFEPFFTGGAKQWLGFPGQGLDEIIRMPFNFVPSIKISPELVNVLRCKIVDFKNKEGSGEVQDSLLPLVSLTLQRIYNKRAIPLRDELFAKQRAKDAETADDLDTRFTAAANSADHDADTTDLSPTVTLTPENCAGYLNVEDAIAELGSEAMEESKAGAGPDWSETSVGDLLRRLVELHGERYSLSYSVMPSAPATRKLAEALRAQRLLLQEPDGRIRLVHEAVLSHWPPARDWAKSERRLLNDAMLLEGNGRDWDHEKRSSDFLLGCGNREVDRAARVLGAWYDLLMDPAVLAHNRNKELLRDFSLDLLFSHPSPTSEVNSLWLPSHLFIAAAYGRADMVRKYIEIKPDSVHQTRADNRTPIFFSCVLGDEAALELFIGHGANIEQADKNGWRPVHLAAAYGHVNCLRQLVEYGANLAPPGTPHEASLLHLAASNGHAAMMRYLINVCGLTPAVTDIQKRTPLHTAALAGQSEAIQVLCEYKVDLEATQDYGWTALHIASREGHVSAVTALIQAGSSVNAPLANRWTPLHVAARNGHVGVARALLAGGADVTATGVNDWSNEKQIRAMISRNDASKRSSHNDNFDWQPLHVAADTGHADMVAVLIDGGAQPDATTAQDETALHLAARKGHSKLITALVAAGADPNSRNANRRMPLQVALNNNQYDFAAVLIQNGADVDAPLSNKNISCTDNWTALQGAAHEGETERAAFLLIHGAKHNAVDAEGRTPLHLAAAKGNSEIVHSLLDHGADAKATARDGTTALHLACLSGHRDIVECLALHGVAIDQAAAKAVTPLHLAARSGASDVVEFLLQRRHGVEHADNDGWTPLHVAAQQGRHQIVRTLLNAGADPDALSVRPHMSPLQIAAEVGHTEVVNALLTAGANIAMASHSRGPAIALAMRYGHFDVVLSLVTHGDSLNQIDPVSGQTLAELFRQALDNRRQNEHAPTDIETRLLAAFSEAGITVPMPVISDTTHAQLTEQVIETVDNQLGNVPYYAWSDLPHEDIGALVKYLNPVDGKYLVSIESTHFTRCTLPWYPGFFLYRLTDAGWSRPQLSLYYLKSPENNWFRLNGTSPPIHEVNKKLPIALNERTVLDYLRFFCFFVRGDEGPFYIVDHLNDSLLPDDPVVRRVLADTIRPASFVGCDQHGHYLCNAVIFYSNALFIANFAVQPNGMLNMFNDEPIAGDLPGKINAPIA